MPDTSMLYSTVKNLTGVRRVFGYLPPHGKTLDAGQTYTVPGDLTTRIALRGGSTGQHRARFKSFERDLLAGRLAIQSTPRPVLYDAAAPAAVADPTVAVTGAVTTAAGGLAAGTYIFAYTWVNAYGESTIGASTSAGVVVAGTTERATLTFPALPTGATSINLYITTAGGAAPATLQLYKTGITTTTTIANIAIPTGTAVPGSNTAKIAAPLQNPVVDVLGGGATGGLLQAGTYYLKYTFTTAAGETTVSGESPQFTVAAAAIPTVTLQALPPGATGANIYLTAASGGTGTETLYASGVTETVYRLATAQATGAAMPGSSTATLAVPTFVPIVVIPPTAVTPLTSAAFPSVVAGGGGGLGSVGGDGVGGDLYGGRLQAGTYFAYYTYTGPAGETTVSPESAQFTVAAGQIPILYFAPTRSSLPAGVTGVNIYLTAANGATTTEKLYKSGLLGTSVALDIPTGNLPIPLSNTTGGDTVQVLRLNAAALGAVDPSWGSYGPVA